MHAKRCETRPWEAHGSVHRAEQMRVSSAHLCWRLCRRQTAMPHAAMLTAATAPWGRPAPVCAWRTKTPAFPVSRGCAALSAVGAHIPRGSPWDASTCDAGSLHVRAWNTDGCRQPLPRACCLPCAHKVFPIPHGPAQVVRDHVVLGVHKHGHVAE